MGTSAAATRAPELSVDCSERAADPRVLRQAFGCFATGVTVITTRAPSGRREGLTANSFASLSLDPPLVLWSLRRNAPSVASFTSAGHFVVNVLHAGQEAVSTRFATPSSDKFAGIACEDGIAGCPVLADRLAAFECRTEQALDAGDHVLFIGRVLHLRYAEGTPLLFAGGRYDVPRGCDAAAT